VGYQSVEKHRCDDDGDCYGGKQCSGGHCEDDGGRDAPGCVIVC